MKRAALLFFLLIPALAVGEDLRDELVQYILRATPEGRALLAFAGTEKNLADAPELAEMRKRLFEVRDGTRKEMEMLLPPDRVKGLRPMEKFWARVGAKRVLEADIVDGRLVPRAKVPPRRPIALFPREGALLDSYASALEDFDARATEIKARRIHQLSGELLRARGVKITETTDPGGVTFWLVEPVLGVSPLNDAAYELSRLPGTRRMAYYGPSLLQNRQNAAVVRNPVKDVNTILLSHQCVADGNLDETDLHEILHELINGLERSGVETIFLGEIRTSRGKASTPYAGYLNLEELATWPLSLRLRAEQWLASPPGSPEAAHHLKYLEYTAGSGEAILTNAEGLLSLARSASGEDFLIHRNPASVDVVVREKDKPPFTITLRFVKPFGDKSDPEIRGLALERLTALAGLARDLRFRFKSMNRIIARGQSAPGFREALAAEARVPETIAARYLPDRDLSAFPCLAALVRLKP